MVKPKKTSNAFEGICTYFELNSTLSENQANRNCRQRRIRTLKVYLKMFLYFYAQTFSTPNASPSLVKVLVKSLGGSAVNRPCHPPDPFSQEGIHSYSATLNVGNPFLIPAAVVIQRLSGNLTEKEPRDGSFH